MLTSRRQLDGKTVHAYFESKRNGPFFCLECGDDVILKCGRNKINHFAHATPLSCRNMVNESDTHRKCKLDIYRDLAKLPAVNEVALEVPLGPVRPDILVTINGIQVAIEVQISSLSLDTITSRTIEYARKGIYVLWLLQWSPDLDRKRYSPKLWEKWIHATYFGHVYYWVEGLKIVSYRFESSLKSVPRKIIYSRSGKKRIVGGYTQRSTRYRMPVREQVLNLATDFGPKERFWWQGGEFKLPDAKLFMHRPLLNN